MENVKDVFISYKSEEYEKANWVKSTLEHNGISCWMAPSSIKGGASYAMEIPRAIRECKVFVLILSEKAQDSKWVPKEIDQAINEGKTIMPFMLENCLLKDDFNFYLTNVQRYEAYQNKSAAIEKMIREIKAVLEKNEEKTAPKENSVVKEEEGISKIIEPQKVVETVSEKKQKKTKPRKEKKEKKTGKKNSRIFKILGATALGIVILAAGGMVLKKTNQIEIAGNIVAKDTTGLYLVDEELTETDLANIEKLEDLGIIELENCTFPDELFEIISNPNMIEISLNNCDLTDEQMELIDFTQLSRLNGLYLNNNPKLSDLSKVAYLVDTLYSLSIDNTSVQKTVRLMIFRF